MGCQILTRPGHVSGQKKCGKVAPDRTRELSKAVGEVEPVSAGNRTGLITSNQTSCGMNNYDQKLLAVR
ncbi:MAG TPA: hypothetical protein VM578_06665 [Candidatus Saccharimonadales bacterium]|nr:hypothetical protein [Candidatus Saccharimonadales bacterium]